MSRSAVSIRNEASNLNSLNRLAAAEGETANWLTHGRTNSEQRFSPLHRINVARSASAKTTGAVFSATISSRRRGSDVEMHPQNVFLSTCDGHLYLPTSSERHPHRRIDEVKVSEVEPLPFRYLKVSGQVYFVAVVEGGFDEDKHVLMPIDGIDGATTEVLDEGHIQRHRE